jgi:hypothetical protein
MPLYNYEYLDDNDQPTGEYVEILQKITDETLLIDPDTNRKIRRVIYAPSVRDSRPAWERCSDVRDYIRSAKPKWVSDKQKGIRERFDPKNTDSVIVFSGQKADDVKI